MVYPPVAIGILLCLFLLPIDWLTDSRAWEAKSTASPRARIHPEDRRRSSKAPPMEASVLMGNQLQAESTKKRHRTTASGLDAQMLEVEALSYANIFRTFLSSLLFSTLSTNLLSIFCVFLTGFPYSHVPPCPSVSDKKNFTNCDLNPRATLSK